MTDARTHIYPLSNIALSSRALSVPGLGNALCASAIFPFRISTGENTAPTDWYEAVMAHGDELDIPDSIAPLPGAEVMVVGNLPPVPVKNKKPREAYLRCGTIHQEFLLYPDSENPGVPFHAGHTAAAWHQDDNPEGRGGNGENSSLSPLIVHAKSPEWPIWLSRTPFDHPVRLRRIGKMDKDTGAGWPSGTDQAVLYEAHSGFWAESLNPGDPLEYKGLAKKLLKAKLPEYRITITSARLDGEWITERARIHSVVLIPAADLGAVFWRTSIALGSDVLGVSVQALVAAVEDVDAPVKEPWHWAQIAQHRTVDPADNLDDRPLLPPAMATTVVSPFAGAASDSDIAAKYKAAEEWAHAETGTSGDNPFGEMPGTAGELADQIQETLDDEGDDPPDANKMEEVATALLAERDRRHKAAGHDEPPDSAKVREPMLRGNQLDGEITRRLQIPYCSARELQLLDPAVDKDAKESQSITELDSKGALRKIADTRLINPKPVLFWPALDETEAKIFGEKLAEKLKQDSLEYHVDVSGAIIDIEDGVYISGNHLQGLLAEETIWRNVHWSDCEFTDCVFAGSTFENCTFENCTFEKCNLSHAGITSCQFNSCTLREMQMAEPLWMYNGFQDCVIEKVGMTIPSMREVNFSNTRILESQIIQGVLSECTYKACEWRDLIINNVHMPLSKLEQVEMFKTWVIRSGLSGCTFEDIKADTCGFLAGCHFDESHFTRVHCIGVSFNAGIFKDTHIASGCLFNACDFSNALFESTELGGVRFVQCPMIGSQWLNVNASGSWFFKSLLRGVDFADTEFSQAVFADADLEGAIFKPEKTIKTDFRGTLKASE